MSLKQNDTWNETRQEILEDSTSGEEKLEAMEEISAEEADLLETLSKEPNQ